MKTIFFEVQEWEKSLLQLQFPDAVLTEDKLSSNTAGKYADAEIVSCFVYSTIDKAVVDSLPALKYVATRSTGFDHIDAAYCKTRNVQVSNVPEYGSRTVAEYTYALMLAVSRKVYEGIHQSKECNFDHKALQGIDLFGKKLGVIGLGKIGTEVIKIAKGFEMKTLVYSRSRKENLDKELNFTYVDLSTLLQEADVITLHLPDTTETHHIINTENIVLCKPGTILVNTARGGLIQTEAILIGLEKGILAGVGLDVLEEENNMTEEVAVLSAHSNKAVDFKTMCIDHVLIHHPHVVVTPHNAFNSKEALIRITNTTIENIKQFISGSTINMV